MSLSIIGAGLGRTGTLSLKMAIELLSCGPCCHMSTVVSDPTASRLWERAYDRQPVDWDEIFKGYKATVDFPACLFYRELAEKYPSAKVILSVRDADAWFKSTQATVLSKDVLEVLRGFRTWPLIEKMNASIFGSDFHDRDTLITAYERHNAEVQGSIPASRLLVYEVKQGWGPLCEFFGRSDTASGLSAS
jgi:Sulfotransferase domain